MLVGYGQPPYRCWPPPACLSVWPRAHRTSAISSLPCSCFCLPSPVDVTPGSLPSPPLLLVWANVHGSFLLGLGVLALEVVWSFLPPAMGRLSISRPLPRKLAGLTFASGLLATLVNPHGPALLAYALKVTSSPQLSNTIAEWQSPNFHSYLYLGVIIGPVLLLIGLLALSRTVFALDDVVLACLMLLAALHAVRFTPYFALAACAMLAPWKPIRTETIRPSVLTLPLAGVLVVALVAGPHVSAGATAEGGPLGAPVAATNFLEHQTGRVFTTYWWGDYLIYRHIPVFVDGRTDLYFGTGHPPDLAQCVRRYRRPGPGVPPLGRPLGHVEQGFAS